MYKFDITIYVIRARTCTFLECCTYIGYLHLINFPLSTARCILRRGNCNKVWFRVCSMHIIALYTYKVYRLTEQLNNEETTDELDIMAILVVVRIDHKQQNNYCMTWLKKDCMSRGNSVLNSLLLFFRLHPSGRLPWL